MKTPYRAFNTYLNERFGTVVYRIPIDAGLDCPNRDGTRAFGGCTFCDARGSGAPTIPDRKDIVNQLITGMERLKKRYKAKKFLSYFQAFSNTYAPEGILRKLYEAGLDHPDVVGLCVGTRPDCVPDNVLDLLAEFNEKTFVWLEMGLQSAFNQTLDLVNRAHSAEEFFDAVKRAQARKIDVATHLIFGLPGETPEMMMETVRQVADSGIQGIKIHQLVVYKDTPMEVDWRLGRLPLLDEDIYIDLVCDALELLPPDMVVMRLVAEGKKDELLAPAWSFDKSRIMEKITARMERRGTRQGARYVPKCTAPPVVAEPIGTSL